LGAKRVKIFTDSQLVASQVTSEYQVREGHLQEYVQLVLEKMEELETIEVTHVPREQNTRVDILLKRASTQTANGNKTVIQERSGELPSDPLERTKLKRRVCSFTLVEGILYKRGFITPFIKCLGPNETQEVLAGVHDGICGQHLCARALAKKVLRAGYFWPTMLKYAKDYVNLNVNDTETCTSHLPLN